MIMSSLSSHRRRCVIVRQSLCHVCVCVVLPSLSCGRTIIVTSASTFHYRHVTNIVSLSSRHRSPAIAASKASWYSNRHTIVITHSSSSYCHWSCLVRSFTRGSKISVIYTKEWRIKLIEFMGLFVLQQQYDNEARHIWALRTFFWRPGFF